ncbi:hypothetical protein QCA50_002114 [Cerrena zonata]|uniref:Mitochondrial cytochrome c oxidase subunit VIa n=1 Tax=Cerrena zonata TaxID=2478898 RepID=A0AAW0GN78_9APHY
MSMIARRSLRVLPRATRSYSATADVAKASYHEKQLALEHHAAQTADMWRKISFYVCLPAIAACALWTRNLEKEHEAHIEHLIHENDGKYPQPPRYDFLYRRARPFPWGNNSLFFNAQLQKDLNEED